MGDKPLGAAARLLGTAAKLSINEASGLLAAVLCTGIDTVTGCGAAGVELIAGAATTAVAVTAAIPAVNAERSACMLIPSIGRAFRANYRSLGRKGQSDTGWQLEDR
ncbi:hypothetical protein MINS_37700 [Mycolicibacterium insubricum]|uniref:Uncharacterized protein n=2 Tax=Mycolicibacterium insubricum TaxID=444597 RepID=A0A1X0DN64_9MYCO|nr:hypothetical protein BST26_02255 [Mycolicibacterium insubricum]BBZ68341.1 hypothetical protein MINS_37700 [Mycolicibacterium insubricum]